MTTLVGGPGARSGVSEMFGFLLALVAQGPAVRVDSNVMIPMRDGVRLATDLYRPAGDGPWPVILIRTPYHKTDGRSPEQARQFAGAGYLVAVQDVRGRYHSEGQVRIQADDADDGYDTVDWLARQPWSTGKVGTTGCSYPGEAQIFLAKRRHPAHAAMIPQAAAGPARYLSVINGGAYELALMFGWLRANGTKVHLQPAPGTPDSLVALSRPFLQARLELPAIDFAAAWRTPLAEMSNRVPGPPTDWEAFVTHGPADSWWDQFNLLTSRDTIATPGLHIGSWYDYGVTETLQYFTRFRREGADARTRDGQYVIIAPTAHCGFERATERTVVGTREVGDARFDFAGSYLRWFDHWLKGAGDALRSMPKVQYYVMGKNEWRAADAWPLPNVTFTKYYLRSDGRANSRMGTGTLSRVAPPATEKTDEYQYDPATPVPSKGGALCCTGTPDAPPGAFDQSDIEMRQDVLVYTTSVLEQGLEVTGPIEAVLYVSSSAKDTDFTVKLIDVYPDGASYNVQEGILRARYRDGFDREVLMTPGSVYPIRINVHATSNFFGPGHRIRVEIASSNFPRFDRNLNTGGANSLDTTMVIARNVIHHSARYPSHLLLPVVP